MVFGSISGLDDNLVAFSQLETLSARLIDDVAPVPLPASGLLLIAGLAALAGRKRRSALPTS